MLRRSLPAVNICRELHRYGRGDPCENICTQLLDMLERLRERVFVAVVRLCAVAPRSDLKNLTSVTIRARWQCSRGFAFLGQFRQGKSLGTLTLVDKRRWFFTLHRPKSKPSLLPANSAVIRPRALYKPPPWIKGTFSAQSNCSSGISWNRQSNRAPTVPKDLSDKVSLEEWPAFRAEAKTGFKGRGQAVTGIGSGAFSHRFTVLKIQA
jgi:hypothetical protein